MPNTTKNIFISHIHEDDAGLSDVKKLLSSAGMTIRDYSINSLKPNKAQNENYIKAEILAPRIRACSALMVYVTADTHTSPWVDWEIRYAMKLGKRIVGVWAPGASDSQLPAALELYADAVVGWRSNRIIDAMDGTINNWERSDGSTRPARPIRRYDCGGR